MSDTWCAYPFLHLATFTNGDVTPCCIAKAYNKINLNNIDVEDAWNHPEVIAVREAMIRGDKVSNCAQCYNDESHGVDSHRTSSNRYFKENFNVDKNSFTQSKIDISNLVTLDLRLGNTCNLKCIMCRPNESHKWYEDIIKLNNEDLTPTVKDDISYKTNYNRNDYNWINKTRFWENIDEILPNIKEFIFGGGEPFMLKEVKHLLKRAVELDVAKNINVRFHTNGTHITAKDFEIFKHFKKAQLMFSLDNIEEINYFLRYPADWDKILETINISEQYSKNVETFVLCSLNSVSAYYLDRLYDFVHNSGWKKLTTEQIILGRVHQPVYLNPQILDQKRKEKIKEKFEYLIDTYPKSKETLESNLNWILGAGLGGTIDDTLSYVNNILKVRKLDNTIIKDFLSAT